MTFDSGTKVRCKLKTSTSLTFDKVYEVYECCPKGNSGDDIIKLYDDNNDLLWYYTKNFESLDLGMQHWVDVGRTLIGKECVVGIGVNAKFFNPYSLHVIVDSNIVQNYQSSVINDYNKNGYSVAVYDYIKGLSYPVKHVSLAPEKAIDMRLGSYDADVFKDRVVVGCQTIPFEKIEELFNHMKSLQ